MADVKISALPAASTPLVGTEVLPLVQSGVTKKVTVTDLVAGSSSNPTVQQTDIGTAPNEIPLNQYLGSMAWMTFAPYNGTGLPAPTIASATTIAPLTPIVFVSGTTTVVTITPPPSLVGGGQLIIIPTGIFTTTTAGNIALASISVVSRALIMVWDATTTKWYPSY